MSFAILDPGPDYIDQFIIPRILEGDDARLTNTWPR
jgi:hypothetical protein